MLTTAVRRWVLQTAPQVVLVGDMGAPSLKKLKGRRAIGVRWAPFDEVIAHWQLPLLGSDSPLDPGARGIHAHLSNAGTGDQSR